LAKEHKIFGLLLNEKKPKLDVFWGTKKIGLVLVCFYQNYTKTGELVPGWSE
jgi:hypothetical protein